MGAPPSDDLWHRVLAPHPVVQDLRRVLEQIYRPGFLVGGVVRDILLYRDRADFRTFDLDLVVVGDPDPVVQALEQAGYRVTKRSQFRTFRLEGPAGKLDVAMARTETYPEPAALPRVRPARSLKEDLARRDFTINSMALELFPTFGRVLDPFGGRQDLEEGWIRVLHLKSFRDDPTRAFRAVRYRVRFGFRYAPETRVLFPDARRYMARLSFERVKNELVRIAQEPEPGRVMEEVAEYGLLQAFRDTWQPEPEVLARLKDLRLQHDDEWPALLVPFVLGPEADLESLPLPRPDRQMLETLRQLLREPPPHDLAEAFDRYERVPPRWLEIAAVLAGRPVFATLALRLRQIRPCLRGNDLEALGLRGAEVGRMLREIRKQWVLGNLQSCEEEKRWVQAHLRSRP